MAPYTTGLAQGLMARGHLVRVLTALPHYPQWTVDPDFAKMYGDGVVSGVPVTRLRHYVPRHPTGIRRVLSEVSFGLRAAFSRWGDPDVVLCISPALISSALILARVRLSRSTVATGVVVQDIYTAGLREIGGGSPILHWWMSLVERWTFLTADSVSVIHGRFKSFIVRELDIEERRVAIIRNWTHISPLVTVARDEMRLRLGWQADEFVILHSGAMGEKQNLVKVVEAASLSDAEGLRLRFVLMGDGSKRNEVMRLAREVVGCQVMDSVAEETYFDVLAAADVLLVNEHPMLLETAMPSKLTSYFASGIPVLAATSALSATAQELEAAGAGVRVDPGSARSLIEGALGLRADPERASALGGNGVRYCHTVLSESSAGDAYSDWVKDLDGSRVNGGTGG